jgi:hypothetical protein
MKNKNVRRPGGYTGYLSAWLHLMDNWDEYRRSGCHIVPVNGKSELIQPLAIAKGMGIPTYIIFDSDADKPDRNGSRIKHEKDNMALLALLGQAGENPMPPATLWGNGFVMWHSDIGSTVKDEIGEADWGTYSAEADQQYGQAGGLRKNVLHVAATLEEAWKAGKRSVRRRHAIDIFAGTRDRNCSDRSASQPDRSRWPGFMAGRDRGHKAL